MASPRIAFGQELRELDDRLLAMGKEAESMLGNALIALAERDLNLANETIARDDIVDNMRFAIEKKCIELIAPAPDARTYGVFSPPSLLPAMWKG